MKHEANARITAGPVPQFNQLSSGPVESLPPQIAHVVLH